MTKYEQKVRERAEEIALITNPKSKGYTLERIAKRCEPIARLSLQREAEAYKEAYNYALSFICDEDTEKWEDLLIKKLHSLGLVP